MMSTHVWTCDFRHVPKHMTLLLLPPSVHMTYIMPPPCAVFYLHTFGLYSLGANSYDPLAGLHSPFNVQHPYSHLDIIFLLYDASSIDASFFRMDLVCVHTDPLTVRAGFCHGFFVWTLPFCSCTKYCMLISPVCVVQKQSSCVLQTPYFLEI